MIKTSSQGDSVGRDSLEILRGVGKLLERFGWSKYRLEDLPGGPVLKAAWRDEGAGRSFELQLHYESEPAELLALVPGVLISSATCPPFALEALRTLVERHNGQLRRGAWLYDADRGAVHFRHSFLLGAELNYESLRSAVITIVAASGEMAREGSKLFARYQRPGAATGLALILAQAREALLLGDRGRAERLLCGLAPEALAAGNIWPVGSKVRPLN